MNKDEYIEDYPIHQNFSEREIENLHAGRLEYKEVDTEE